jgi:hypothetical protein
VNGYLASFISAVLVASIGVLCNIIYFKYQNKLSARKEILEAKITKLLMPLYFCLNEDDLKFLVTIEYGDPYEYIADTPSRLINKITKIIGENLYLADDELQGQCLDFLKWAYNADWQSRYDQAHINGLEDKEYKQFAATVTRKYKEAVQLFHKQ